MKIPRIGKTLANGIMFVFKTWERPQYSFVVCNCFLLIIYYAPIHCKIIEMFVMFDICFKSKWEKKQVEMKGKAWHVKACSQKEW